MNNHLKTLLAHIRSRRGLLLIAASIAGVLAIGMDGSWSVFFGLIALAGYSSLILLLSIRVSQTVAGIQLGGRTIAKPPTAIAAKKERSTRKRAPDIRMTSAT